MKIGFCTLPLKTGHKNRGIGYYTYNLLEQLKKNPDVEIVEFDSTVPENVDLIHYPWFDFFFKTLPILKKKPTIVTVHDTIPLIFPDNFPTGIKAKINFLIQKFSLKNCQSLLVDSKDSKRGVIKYLNISPNKIVVTYLAQSDKFKVLPESQKLKIKRKFNLPDKFILYVGDINYSKNLPFLIDGFRKIAKEYEDINLVLIGDPFLKKLDNIDHPELRSLKEVNKKIIDFNLEDKVIRPGRIETNDLVGFYNLATVYVQPSLYEGFGLPILEAFSSGCPVISSNAGSLPEVAGEAAILFDSRDLDQFVSVLKEVLQDKTLRDKLSKIGIKQAENFSWEKTAKETINVYKQVLSTQ